MTAIKLPNFVKKQPIALVCVLICIGLSVALYLCAGTMAEANDLLAQKRSDGEHLSENVKNANKLDEQLAAMTQANQAIEARLVHADKIPINLQYFYEIVSATQTKLTELNQLPSASKNTGKAYAGVRYAIVVDGTYPQLLDFLRRCENGEHFSRVLGVTLSSGSGEETSGKTTTLSLNLNLELLGLP
jgi:hypothetical protein